MASLKQRSLECLQWHLMRTKALMIELANTPPINHARCCLLRDRLEIQQALLAEALGEVDRVHGGLAVEPLPPRQATPSAPLGFHGVGGGRQLPRHRSLIEDYDS
jgi:hypothetical protein